MNPKIRILLVDDSPSIRLLIRGFVDEDPSLEIFEASDGESAEHILQEQNVLMEPIDVVFLDWMMPKLSGFELLKKIRSADQFFHQPAVIMLTAETYLEQIDACMKFKVSKYLTKPFTRREVLSALTEIVEDRGLRRAI